MRTPTRSCSRTRRRRRDGVVEVPRRREPMSDSSIRATKSAARCLIEAGPQPTLALLPLEERHEVAGDELERPVLLRGQQREQPLGLGDEDLLQDDVLPHRPVREQQAVLDEAREVGRADDRLGERRRRTDPSPRPRPRAAAGPCRPGRRGRPSRATRPTPSPRPRPSSCRARSGRSRRTPPRGSARAAPGPAARGIRVVHGYEVEERVEPDGHGPRRPATLRTASSTPGMNDDRS